MIQLGDVAAVYLGIVRVYCYLWSVSWLSVNNNKYNLPSPVHEMMEMFLKSMGMLLYR
jgi:hypothetical protein